MKSFKIPILISIILHATLFLSLAWIKLDSRYDVREKVSIALVEKKTDRPKKRSIPTRKTSSFTQPINRDIITTSVNLNVTNLPSNLVYDKNSSPAFSDNIGKMEYKGNDIIGNKSVAYRDVLKPISTPIKEINTRSNSPKIDKVEGNNFIINKPLTLENPKISFAQSDTKALSKFLETIRKKIESNKKYPIFAMNAGIEGRCGIILTILSNGKLENAEIDDSSGNEILDNAALESVRNSTPFPPIPPEVGRDKINMSISLVFRLSQMGR